MRIFASPIAEVAQLVEHDLAKVGVAGPNPVFRSKPSNIRGFFYPTLSHMLTPHTHTHTHTHTLFALVVELVDTQDLKSCDHCGRAGSSPARGTEISQKPTSIVGFFILSTQINIQITYSSNFF